MTLYVSIDDAAKAFADSVKGIPGSTNLMQGVAVSFFKMRLALVAREQPSPAEKMIANAEPGSILGDLRGLKEMLDDFDAPRVPMGLVPRQSKP